ncbi:hypothetical protein Goari_004664 [Gossypium aridum]|uniref:Uncharacterized protein n=1 Tax=Gossypium aridum TaxID=34290 RepID=A0A7J8Y5M7_GOSAI|nr:hypothetical protein [Gossypium aridum]
MSPMSLLRRFGWLFSTIWRKTSTHFFYLSALLLRGTFFFRSRTLDQSKYNGGCSRSSSQISATASIRQITMMFWQ